MQSVSLFTAFLIALFSLASLCAHMTLAKPAARLRRLHPKGSLMTALGLLSVPGAWLSLIPLFDSLSPSMTSIGIFAVVSALFGGVVFGTSTSLLNENSDRQQPSNREGAAA